MTIDVNQQVLNAKRQHEEELLSRANVQTVGVGHKNDTTEECIVVGVSQKVPEDQLNDDDVIPDELDGVKTDVQEVGVIVPEVLQLQPERTGTFRPVPHGVSVAHPSVTAGTSGWMYETDDGTIYLGSNNHVLANSNDASEGDVTLQPGPADGGSSPDDQIGTLAYYTTVEDGVNVDLAIAEMTAEVENSLYQVDAPIAGVVESLAVDDELVKSGRTTGVTRNTIQQLDASVNVNYGGSLGSVTVTGCIVTGDMSEGGDSGSSTAKEVDGELRAAGRLFAGSSSITVHHHIESELDRLTIEFDSTIQLMTNGGTERPTASVTLTLTETAPGDGDIEATVNDQEGNPIEEASVDVSGPANDSKITSADGTVAFTGVPVGEYSIVASKQGYDEDSVDITGNDFQ